MRHSHLKSFAQKQCAEGVSVGSVHLRQPVLTASGTAGHSTELNHYFNMSQIGATVAKSLFATPWPGNPAPRVHPTPAGMINAVGLQGPGMAEWIANGLPECEKHGVTVVASIWGRTVEEYRQAAEMLAPHVQRIAALEVNLSCPNLEGRGGIIAHDAEMSASVIAACAVADVPLWAKLSPNTDRLITIAESVVEAGAESLTLTNTLLGMLLNTDTAQPVLGNGGGGVSGRAMFPVALRAVFDVRKAMPHIPIVGVGGIASGNDAIAMMQAGAHAVQVGTASFARPDAAMKVLNEMHAWVRKQGVSRWSEITNAAHRS
ncbi:MAG: dihydroorotate dehydrogenase [Ilumatobacteraceae bacterium]|jgi:dihydroorotate dehydrogenase (NAD+) catalytic subunit|nr:dihydroorotate dehydrogenase [Ilumatobacteraceae bacterium]